MSIKDNTTMLQSILDTVNSLPTAGSSSSSSIIIKESECIISNGEIIVPGDIYIDLQDVEDSLIGCIAYTSISFSDFSCILCMNSVYAQYINDSGSIDFNDTQNCIRFQDKELYWNVDPGVSRFTNNVTKFKLIAFLRK